MINENRTKNLTAAQKEQLIRFDDIGIDKSLQYRIIRRWEEKNRRNNAGEGHPIRGME